MCFMRVCVLLCGLLTAFAAGSSDAGSCLLAKRKQMAKARSLTHNAAMHLTWRLHFEGLQRATNASKNALEEAVRNNNPDDPCSARVLQAKEKLDGLKDDVDDIAKKIKGHQGTLETETEAMNVAQQSINEVKDDAAEQLADCEKQKEEGVKDLAKYKKKKDDLDSIAAAANAGTNVPPSVSLLDGSRTFDRQSCLAFLSLTKRTSKTGVNQAPEDDEQSCDDKREELAKKFVEAYDATEDLIGAAEDRANDTTCEGTVEAKKAGMLAPLTAEEEEAADKTDKSTDAIDHLKPVLEKLEKEQLKLDQHINEDLKPECVEAEQVSEALEKVHDEIEALANCPTKKDWKLGVPGGEDGDTDPAVSPESPTLSAMNAGRESQKEIAHANESDHVNGDRDPNEFSASNAGRQVHKKDEDISDFAQVQGKTQAAEISAANGGREPQKQYTQVNELAHMDGDTGMAERSQTKSNVEEQKAGAHVVGSMYDHTNPTGVRTRDLEGDVQQASAQVDNSTHDNRAARNSDTAAAAFSVANLKDFASHMIGEAEEGGFKAGNSEGKKKDAHSTVAAHVSGDGELAEQSAAAEEKIRMADAALHHLAHVNGETAAAELNTADSVPEVQVNDLAQVKGAKETIDGILASVPGQGQKEDGKDQK